MGEYPKRIFTFQKLLDDRAKQRIDDMFKGKFTFDLTEKLAFFHDDTKLLITDTSYSDSKIIIEPNLPEKIETELFNAIDRTGSRTPYRCEFYPSANSQNSPNLAKYGVKYAEIDQTLPNNPSFSTFTDWYSGWLNNRIIVPDTCILQNHYLSTILLPRLKFTPKIMIPRVAILELEFQGNRPIKQKEIPIKPVIFSAFNEIRKLQLSYGAKNFPDPIKGTIQVNLNETFGAFGGGDRLLRLEVEDYLRFQSGNRSRTITPENDLILLTKDMMMASTASAEGLDTFYLCPAQQNNILELKNLSQLVNELAIAFSEIRIEGFFKDHDVCCEGIWSGKDIMDWGLERLRFQFRDKK